MRHKFFPSLSNHACVSQFKMCIACAFILVQYIYNWIEVPSDKSSNCSTNSIVKNTEWTTEVYTRVLVFASFEWHGAPLFSSRSARHLYHRTRSWGYGLRHNYKQGQKLVLSDALAVQSRGPKVLSPKLVFGSQQMFWDFKECFGISKNALGSQKMYWNLKKS